MNTFNNLARSNSWIASAERNLERVYQNNYFDPAQVARTADLIIPTSDDNSTSEDEFRDTLFGPTQLPHILPVPRGRGRPATASVLISTIPRIIQYLSENVKSRKIDPIQWWQLNRPQYPILSQMAGDYLAVPASSVPSEQILSLAK